MKYVYEILNEVLTSSSPADKVRTLQIGAQANPTFKTVLQGAMHPNIKFVIKKIPEYKRSIDPAGMGYTDLNQEINRIYLFTEGSTRVAPELTLERKTVILAQMLEAMEPQEATVLENMIMKDLKIPGLTAKLVEEAFPGLLH